MHPQSLKERTVHYLQSCILLPSQRSVSQMEKLTNLCHLPTQKTLTFIDPGLGFGRGRRVLRVAFCLVFGFGRLVFSGSNAASGFILAEQVLPS